MTGYAQRGGQSAVGSARPSIVRQLGALPLLGLPVLAGIALCVTGPLLGPAWVLGLAFVAMTACVPLVLLDRLMLGLRALPMTAATLVLGPLGYFAHFVTRGKNGARRLIIPALLSMLVFVLGTISRAGIGDYLAAAAIDPDLAELGPLVVPTKVHAAATFGPAGGKLTLSDGASLVVAPGALSAPITIRMERVNLRVELLAPYVEHARAYVVGSSDDARLAKLSPPAALELPLSAGQVGAGRWQDGDLVRVTPSGDARARIELTAHKASPLGASTRAGLGFSPGRVFGTEWGPLAVIERVTAAMTPANPAKAKESDIIRDHYGKPGMNPAVVDFYGIGDAFTGSREQLCKDFQQQMIGYPGASYDYPPDSDFRNNQLKDFLHESAMQSATQNYFWKLTESNMGDIKMKVLAAERGSLTPAKMLKVCLDSTHGNVPLAVLACHNFLKDITAKGRRAKLDELPMDAGEVAARLVTWRSSDRSPAGEYDKMGPIYHTFAAATAGVWFNGMGLGGHAARTGEWMIRTLGPLLSGDGKLATAGREVASWVQIGTNEPADPEKGEADVCGAAAATLAREKDLAGQLGGMVPEMPSWPSWLPGGSPSHAGGGAADAGHVHADGGAASDGGEDEDGGDGGEATGNAAADAAPDADTAPKWAGNYAGTCKATVKTSTGTNVTGAGAISVAVVMIGDGKAIRVIAAKSPQPWDMDIDPANPAHASGVLHSHIGNGVVSGSSDAALAASLAGDTLTLSSRGVGEGQVHSGQINGVATASSVMDCTLQRR